MADRAGSPHLADATDLERWADRRSAQADLPRLIRRLIRHENDQTQRLEMRAGEGVGLPGYDGIVEATRATSFVPEGLSVWEMGTSEDPAGKATDDYKGRTADSLGVDMASTTFVFVTPRRWRNKKAWEQKRRDEGKWRDVRVLDADDIEQALYEAAAVRVWLSELLEMPALAVATIEDWWYRFSTGFDPTLTSGMVLAGRENDAARLLRRLAVDIGQTFIKAASVDDGLAFAACAMMAQGVEESEPMLSRSLLVHDGQALRRLDSTSSLLILLPYEEHLRREAQLIRNHHVVFIVTEGGADIELPPLDHLALEAVLRETGVADADLPRFARAGTKSLVALQRVAARFEQVEPGQWLLDLAQRPIRRAWLAGSWNHLRSGDVDVMEGLTSVPRDDLVERLEVVVRQPDPIFTRVGATWAVAAPEDSWRVARHTIQGADLEELERAVQNVLGAVDPRLELPPADRWTAEAYGKARVHSSDLRKGLARTLAILGSWGDEVRLAGGRSGSRWAERVVWELVRRANLDDSARMWASIEDVLPLLAEAAPDTFLRAVAESTAGTDPLARRLFQDHGDASWNASSPHTGLLWALECVAWSERHMGFAAEVLASLAEIDPGGKLSNRPAASLHSIFRAWLPQTSAPRETRIRTLDALLQRHKEVAWRLLLNLLPGPSEVGEHSSRPRFRVWGQDSDGPAVTYGELFATVDAIAERLIGIANDEPHRWADIVPVFDRLPDERKRVLIAALGALHREELDDPAVVSAIWSAIQNFVRRHRQYPNADWSVSEEWLNPLAEVGERLRPALPSTTHRWLFDDWSPDLSVSVRDDFAVYQSDLRRAREEACRRIVNEQGLGAVIELASAVLLSSALGAALANVANEHDSEVLSLLDSGDGRLVQFADGYARTRGAGALTAVTPLVEQFTGRPLVQARLLHTVSDVAAVWELLPSLDPDVDKAYWAEFVPYGRGADFPHVREAVQQLLRHGRVAMAVDTLSLYVQLVEGSDLVDLVVEALTDFGSSGDPDVGRVSEHDLSSLLGYLRSSGTDEDRVAQLEWKFLPILHHEAHAPSLQRLLAREPSSFVQMVELAFKPAKSITLGEKRDVRPELAANAYRLLREWRVIPGTKEDGSVDAAALQSWLEDVRDRLDEVDRREIGEVQIGEVFAHAPSDPDGTFPTEPVRDVLETATNDRLERGFTVGLYNKRGVTWRGMTDGGKQEYELAEEYEAWARGIEATHPRTASSLRAVAESYRDEGRRNDEEAKRFFEGLDL